MNNPKKKLYLHLGFHKTGSTSFQMTCTENIQQILDQGILFPIFNSSQIALKNIDNHGFVLRSLYMKNPDKYQINVLNKAKNIKKLNRDYKATLEQALNLGTDVILSGECISFFNVSEFRKLKNILTAHNFEIIPLIVVRSPYEFHCSLKQQMIKMGTYKKDDFFYLQKKKIENIRAVFPDAQFFPFREICKHKKGPVGFLFDCMGIDYTDFKFIKNNEAHSNGIIRIQNELNKKDPAIINDKLNPFYVDLIGLDNELFQQKFLLSQEEYQFVKIMCEAENEYLKRNLGEEFCDKEIKFYEPNEMERLCIQMVKMVSDTYRKKDNFFIQEIKNLMKKPSQNPISSDKKSDYIPKYSLSYNLNIK